MVYGEAIRLKNLTKNIDISQSRMGYEGNGNAAWAHRCFMLRCFKKGWKAKNIFPAFSPDMPKSFIWNVKQDRHGLCDYIDSLLLGQRSKASDYEHRGFISDVEMSHIERPEDPRIVVNIKRLVDFLLLRDGFNIPLWGKILFVTDGTQIVPKNFIAALMQLDADLARFFDSKKTWKSATYQDLLKMGVKPDEVTSSMYREKHAPLDSQKSSLSVTPSTPVFPSAFPQASVTNAREETPPQEIRLSLKKYDEHFDLLTQVRPDGAQPYYTRRIATNDGALLWCGTAYDLNGPWTVWTRDSAQLMALGIDL